MNTELQSLDPAIVWKHFAAQCAIPHPSKHEHRLREAIVGWCHKRSLETRIDDAGNLIVRKPAASGAAHKLGVVLQAHLDMVCERNTEVEHDFLVDPIRPVIKDGWVVAEQTTLGADNGIGVAIALAVLEADNIQHGPLEVLLTVDEEQGMGGAKGLASDEIRGRFLINLDSEEWGDFYVGCAGGIELRVERKCVTEVTPDGHAGLRIFVNGLQGGHSGCDIHLGRGNANIIAMEVLRRLHRSCDARLGSMSGGTLANAIPREAVLLVAIATKLHNQAIAVVDEYRTEFNALLAGVGEHIDICVEPTPINAVTDRQLVIDLLDATYDLPNGPFRMSEQLAGVVETSSNLGVLLVVEGLMAASILVRSLYDNEAARLSRVLCRRFQRANIVCEETNSFPGWTPASGNALLTACQSTFGKVFGVTPGLPRVKVIHAGIECGILGAKYPSIEMVSLGPTIRGPHAPGERVSIASVAALWDFIQVLLASLPGDAAPVCAPQVCSNAAWPRRPRSPDSLPS